jgi:uncharacterized membrane protein YidH (DUF202 family)
VAWLAASHQTIGVRCHHGATVLLGCGYASLAMGLLIVGALRQRELEPTLRTGAHVPLQFRTVGLFTAGGVALAVMTVVLVLAQT